MTSFSLTFIRFFRALSRGFREPKFRRLVFIVVALLSSGTIVYHFVEGWDIIDALYFSMTTLTTVGTPMLYPNTIVGKIFTMVYLMVGIGVMLSLLTKLAEEAKKEASVVGGLTNDGIKTTKKILKSLNTTFTNTNSISEKEDKEI